MTRAARTLLAALPADQRAKVTRSFDDPERTTWSFTRRNREGLYVSEIRILHKSSREPQRHRGHRGCTEKAKEEIGCER
jgi:hypothetical protein